MKNLIWAAVLALSACARGVAPEAASRFAAPSARPRPGLAYVDAAAISSSFAVDRSALSKIELEAVDRALAKLPTFPGNALNGCQSRAHVTFLTLAPVTHGKLHKVWIFSGQFLSPVVPSSIDYQPPGGGTPHWDYHVAIAYTAPSEQTMVVDTLISAKPQRLEDWVGHFVFKGPAVLMFVPGPNYSFFTSSVKVADKSWNVFNGGFFEYAGITQQSRDGAKAIAADALAVAFAEGRYPSCPWVKDQANAIELIRDASPYLPIPTWDEAADADNACKELQKTSPGVECPPLSVPPRPVAPPECMDALRLFQQQVERWKQFGL